MTKFDGHGIQSIPQKWRDSNSLPRPTKTTPVLPISLSVYGKHSRRQQQKDKCGSSIPVVDGTIDPASDATMIS